MLDGSTKSLHALARIDCDLAFNLAESFGGNDTADYCIAAYLELIGKRFTGAGSRGLLYGGQAVAKKISLSRYPHARVARSFRGRPTSRTPEFRIVKPAREDGSIGIDSMRRARSASCGRIDGSTPTDHRPDEEY